MSPKGFCLDRSVNTVRSHNIPGARSKRLPGRNEFKGLTAKQTTSGQCFLKLGAFASEAAFIQQVGGNDFFKHER